MNVFRQTPVHPSTECTCTDTLNSDPLLFFMAHAIKYNHKLTHNPPLNLIAVADKHFLPLLDDEKDNDANPSDLMGKYDGGVILYFTS